MKHWTNPTWFAIAVLASSVVACNYSKGGTIPTDVGGETSTSISGDNKLSARDVATLTGEWTGSETATVGESGTLTAVFSEGGSVALTWKSSTTVATGNGTATGSLSALSITSDATKCGYSAFGTLSADQNTITGTYQGSGPGVCPTKKGSFTLTRTVKVVDVCPNLEGVQLKVPDGYVLKDGQCVIPPKDVCPNLEGVQETVPDGYELKDGQCVKTPPPSCESLNVPSFDTPTLEKTNGNKVQGKVHKIHNAATWTLKLYRNGDKIDDATKTLKCKQDEDIDVSYAGNGHSDSNNPKPDPLAGDYVLKLYQDGVLVYTSTTLHITS